MAVKEDIDYDALAKKLGAIDSSAPAKDIDYDTLALKHGALTLKDIAPKPSSLEAAGTQLQGEAWGDPEQSKEMLTGLVESVPTMATGLPVFVVGTFAKAGNGIINTLRGSDKPWYEAVEQTDKFLDKFTYHPGRAGAETTKGLTYGMVAYTAPYLLPFLGVSEALDTEAAKKHLTDEQIARLKVANDVLMIAVPSVKVSMAKRGKAATAEVSKPIETATEKITREYLYDEKGNKKPLTPATAEAYYQKLKELHEKKEALPTEKPTEGPQVDAEGYEQAATEIDPKTGKPMATPRPVVHPDWFEGLPKPGEKVAPNVWDQELGRAVVSPDTKITNLTVKEITEGLARGDKSMLPHVEEAVKKMGPTAATDSFFNGAFGKAGKNKTLKEFGALEPELRKTLKGESITNVPREKIVIPIQKYLKESQKQTEFSGNILDDYYKLQGADKADTNRLHQLLDNAKGKPEDYEAIYNHIENPKEPLTPAQNELLKTEIAPLRESRDKVYSNLQDSEVPLSDDLYTPRKVANKGGIFDRIMAGFRGTREGSILGKSAGPLKHRVLMAAENAVGQRRVIAVKGGEVVAWDKGKADPLGPLKFTDFEEMLGDETKPLDREIAKIERELETLDAAQSREWKYRDHLKELARKTKIEKLENEKAEILERYNPNDLNRRLFKDKDGQTWTIKQATTKEIEANTDLRYHKNSLLNEATTYNNLRRVERATQYLENLKRNPEFNRIAVKIGSQNLPKGYKTTSLPQLRGYAFPERIAETFDAFYKKSASGILDSESAYTAVNRVLRNSIFFNPLIHIPNIVNHAFVNRGAQWANPVGYPRLIRTGARAIRDVLTMNENYNKMLEAGAPLLYSETVNRNLYKVMLEKMGAELKTNDPKVIAIAKDLGMKPIELVKAVYNFSGKATWSVNDIATLQSIYEQMDRGMPIERAIEETGRHIPNYRIPPRIMGSKTISNLMKGDSGVTMFGAYHYGALRSYGEMIKEITGKISSPVERAEAAGKIAVLALTTYFIYPQLDKAAQWASNNPNTEVRRAGASTFPANTEKLAKGQIDFAQWMQAVLTPSVGFNVAVEAYYGRDPRTGKKIPYTEIAKRSLAPIAQGSKVAEGSTSISKFLWGLGGVSLRDRPQPTPAEVVMNKLAFHSDKEADAGTVAYNKVKKEAKTLLRKDKEEGEKFLVQQWEDKKLSKDQVNRIHREVYDADGNQIDEFQARFKQFGVARTSSSESSYAALKIYAEMNPDQKVKVNNILNEKMQRAWEQAEDTDLPAGQMSPAQEELMIEWKKYIPALETP